MADPVEIEVVNDGKSDTPCLPFVEGHGVVFNCLEAWVEFGTQVNVVGRFKGEVTAGVIALMG